MNKQINISLEPDFTEELGEFKKAVRTPTFNELINRTKIEVDGEVLEEKAKIDFIHLHSDDDDFKKYIRGLEQMFGSGIYDQEKSNE